ncbi:hypothetical protein RhiirA4_464155 [Rhizophagus irregularis]|uniref:Uncharacterized protein n=1 Tax=Rhizophagus irregularis TaxID=588596 RepID=A0A2I1GPI5_9GLOM|nr:hypothetical protein RhiirA4_464155 [Rhizophagus irregularis]
MTGAPCKHQGAVSVKFYISMFNFVPSLTSNDRMIYTYIAIGYTAEDCSFYASLHAEFIPLDREGIQMETTTPNNNLTIEHRESNKNVEDDIITFINFLEEIKEDYSNGCAQLHTALNKFAECYKAAKLKSIPRSGSMIRVQVESVKRQKTEGSGRKRKSFSITNNKENLENSDPQIIPGRKTKKIGKKEHNLSKNVLKNQLN